MGSIRSILHKIAQLPDAGPASATGQYASESGPSPRYHLSPLSPAPGRCNKGHVEQAQVEAQIRSEPESSHKPKAISIMRIILSIASQAWTNCLWDLIGLDISVARLVRSLDMILVSLFWRTILMSLHCSSAYSCPCFFRPVRFVSLKCLPRISLSFAFNSSIAGGGNEVNAKYHAWNSSE